MRLMFLILTAVGLTFSCKEKGPTLTAPDNQQVLFEIRFVNFAKMFTWRGVYVNRQGDVFQYDATGTSRKLLEDYTVEAQLLEQALSAKSEKIGKVNIDTLSKNWLLVAKAAQGEKGKETSLCRDYGQIQYMAHTLDASGQNYQATVLLQAGDIAYRNLAPEAETLANWLRTLSERYESSPCMPQ